MVQNYKYILVEYLTPQKQQIINTFYYKEKKEVVEHLGINYYQFENWINKKLKLKKKELKHLAKFDIFRKFYAYKEKTIEDKVKMPIKDFEELLKIIRHNLIQINNLKIKISEESQNQRF